MTGIKESKELIVGAFAVASLLVKALKDGLQAREDAVAVVEAILRSPELRAKLQEAATGLLDVKSEVYDLSLIESFEIVSLVVSEAQKLVVGQSA